MNNTRKFLAASSFLLIAATSGLTLAQDGFVRPVPQNQEGRLFPGFGTEAVIRTRFTVKADGTVDNVEIIDGFTNQFYDNMVKESIEKWTYTPGTVNGEAVEFLNQEVVVKASIAEGLSISPTIQEAVDELTAMIGAGDYDKAAKEVNSLLRRGVGTVFDYALMQEMLATIETARQDPYAALEASKRATMSYRDIAGNEAFLLTPEMLEQALRKHFLLAATIRQHGEAMRTFEKLQRQIDIPADDWIMEQAEVARASLDSPEPLALLAKIVDKQWTHVPTRRIFTVTNVNGRLNRIEARCDRRNLELDYQPDVDWTLPASFGNCELDFIGRDGTTFVVYEFAE